MESTSHRIVAMPHLCVIRVTGEDAQTFLQSQLSRSIDDLAPGESRLAGWHDARGRVRAIFRVLYSSGSYLLSVPTDLAEQLCAALRMFVLRADVSISLQEQCCAGLVIPAKQAPVAANLRGLPETINAVADDGRSITIRIAPDCWHIIGETGDFADAAIDGARPVDAAEIRAGLPQVDARTTSRYVPHMLNLDRLGALDFEKGCYPGQEVIARTQHLGNVKRRARAFVVSDTAPPDSETPLVDATGAQIGSVLRAARDTDGRLFLLGVVALEAIEHPVFLNSGDGPLLEHFLLPFE